jgi:hypothetical protein
MEILIFEGLTERRLYKSFDVKQCNEWANWARMFGEIYNFLSTVYRFLVF